MDVKALELGNEAEKNGKIRYQCGRTQDSRFESGQSLRKLSKP